MNIDDFIKDRETPYSKITNVKENDDGTVSFTEKYDLTHPLCPIVSVQEEGKTIKRLNLNKTVHKDEFKLIGGKVTILD